MSSLNTIYYGPTKDFEKLIDEDSNILNLRDLVKMMDSIESFNKWLENKPEIPYILLCYGEAFYSIREHFIENLPSVINYLFIDGYIDSCLMQNPPSAFIQSMKRVF
ncbi:TPA_asm: hypothetical protein GI947_15155, partial [Listeria monocytogenes]|nr:hypothetical protein [Listeria monocytogenes]